VFGPIHELRIQQIFIPQAAICHGGYLGFRIMFLDIVVQFLSHMQE
jgi:hypothetical protein